MALSSTTSTCEASVRLRPLSNRVSEISSSLTAMIGTYLLMAITKPTVSAIPPQIRKRRHFPLCPLLENAVFPIGKWYFLTEKTTVSNRENSVNPYLKHTKHKKTPLCRMFPENTKGGHFIFTGSGISGSTGVSVYRHPTLDGHSMTTHTRSTLL